jgi:putative AbiEii toxin of type IV toxin-antitoxin system
LQAIWVASECLRLCVDRNSWQIATAGRALAGFDLLPANEPEDLWFARPYRVGNQPRPIKIRVELSDGFYFETLINFYFGAINVKIADWNRAMGSTAIQGALLLAPMLIPRHVEIGAHEESRVPAQIHRFALSGQLSSILRNVLLSLSTDRGIAPAQEAGFSFVADAIKTHFELELKHVFFDPIRDLEIRAPYDENGCELDIVSAGSGLHQILKLAAFISWRKAKIVLLDEPDAHLHASLQARLSLFLNMLSHSSSIQVILATHSRDLISRPLWNR